jgi:hypothetical protein
MFRPYEIYVHVHNTDILLQNRLKRKIHTTLEEICYYMRGLYQFCGMTGKGFIWRDTGK